LGSTQFPQLLHSQVAVLHVEVWEPTTPQDCSRVSPAGHVPPPRHGPKSPQVAVAAHVRVFVPQLPHGSSSVEPGVHPQANEENRSALTAWQMPSEVGGCITQAVPAAQSPSEQQ